jgi:hypothetical protein
MTRGTGRRYFAEAAFPVAMAIGLACSGDDGGGSIYRSTCDQACAHAQACGEIEATEVSACVADCRGEPWPPNVRECRATTCGSSEADCERFSLSTCAQACDHSIGCGAIAPGDGPACVGDCTTEPWPGLLIDCLATTCRNERQCESFTGE